MTAVGERASQDTLERWYRRLLLAYPARYRRHRGVEILTTLMDAAPAGRTRPGVGQIIDLVFGGLRYRLAPDRTPVVIVAAVFAALFVGVFGAIGGSLAGWRSAGNLPDNTAAATIAQAAIPSMPSTPYDRRDSLFGYDAPLNADENPVAALLIGGDNYDAGHVRFITTHTSDDLATLRSARERLRAAGWRVEPVARESYGGTLSASRNGLFVQLTTEGGGDWAKGGQQTSLRIYRAPPSTVPVLTVLGLLIGGLTGWLLVQWAARRVATQPPWRKTATIVPFMIASVLLLLPMGLNLIAIVLSLAWAEPTPTWTGYAIFPTRVMALLGTPLLIGTLLVVAAPSTPARWRRLRRAQLTKTARM